MSFLFIDPVEPGTSTTASVQGNTTTPSSSQPTAAQTSGMVPCTYFINIMSSIELGGGKYM